MVDSGRSPDHSESSANLADIVQPVKGQGSYGHHIDRRNLLRGLGLAAALGGAGSVSGCAPAATELSQMPQNFFGLIASRKFEQARALLTPSSMLTIVTQNEHKSYAEPKNIVTMIANLIHSFGFSMVGDNRDYAPGGIYWVDNEPWLSSDLLRGDAVTFSTCEDDLGEEVLNVHIISGSYTEPKTGLQQTRIQSILLLENSNLAISPIHKYTHF